MFCHGPRGAVADGERVSGDNLISCPHSDIAAVAAADGAMIVGDGYGAIRDFVGGPQVAVADGTMIVGHARSFSGTVSIYPSQWLTGR